MHNVKLILHTGTHCIETEAKNMFRRITEQLLGTDDIPATDELGRKLELLREFIETADFNALRSSDERLAGITEGVCLLSRDPKGKAVIKIINQRG